jgi:hypothetical protein
MTTDRLGFAAAGTGTRKKAMKWLLNAIYGPNAAADPYYQFFMDADALIPWWYPTMIAAIAGAILLYRLHGWMKYRRQAVLAAERVQHRTRRRAVNTKGH